MSSWTALGPLVRNPKRARGQTRATPRVHQARIGEGGEAAFWETGEFMPMLWRSVSPYRRANPGIEVVTSQKQLRMCWWSRALIGSRAPFADLQDIVRMLKARAALCYRLTLPLRGSRKFDDPQEGRTNPYCGS
jgi:hypothetical protein